MGCEVWPSPFFATMTDMAVSSESRRQMGKGQLTGMAMQELTGALTARARRGLTEHLTREVLSLAVELPPEELARLAQPYVGARSNYLILICVAKIVDFLRRGAAGAISAAGLNCLVGTATGAVIPAIRAGFEDAPVISLTYGGAEGPAQRIRLETFVHQVRARWRPLAA